MGYKLAASNGDTLAVPQLVLTHLTQTDGDTIRAALYILQTHDTDPRTGPPLPRQPSLRGSIWPAWPTTPMLPFCARRRKASSVKR